ncbi:ras protein [Mycena galopus ATCC 62051]|nr:ras protein [Mycena galopus ATCC 62051]
MEFRVTILGDAGVGKTALGIQFECDAFVEICDSTNVDGYFRKQIIVDNRICFMQIIDTPTQEEYALVLDQLMREGQGFILVYSIASRSSFDRLESLLESVKRVKGDDPILILVGNKCDQPEDRREVSKEEGASLARQFGCEFIETSAKTKQNVERMVMSLVRALRQTESEPALTLGRPLEKRKKCIIL